MFAALDPRYRVAGTPLENVAEEVLNGLFCHYEPPTSEYAQHKAANNVRLNPKKYSFSQVKKSQSILRTSRLYRKKQAAAEARKKRKGVTWRDEQNRKGLEGKVEACAADCDFFGLSTKGGNGLADSLSPTHGTTMQNPVTNPFPEPGVVVEQPTTVITTEQDGPPKKVLYDDEGNPISDEDPSGDVIVDENVPPPTTTPLNSAQNQPVIPPAPTGLSQLRKMARQLDDDDVYEPENYDQPQRAQPLAYKRIRSPPLRKTPRNEDFYGDEEDKITMARSQSPIPNDTPNHYDTPEQFQDHRRTPTRGRPSTPHRRRVEDTDYDSTDNSILDNGDVKLNTSKNRQGGYGQQGVLDSSRDNSKNTEQTNPVSPARRSEVFSDLTMDEALYGRLGSRYPPVSPAASSEGVEVDVVAGRPRPRSRSPSRYQNETKQSTTTTTTTTDGNEVGRQELTMSKDASVDTRSYKRREKKTGELSIDDGNVLVSEVKAEKPKTTKTSKSGADNPKLSKSSTTKDNEEQQLRKIPSRRHAPAVDTDCDADDAKIAINMKRDPTPRMSSEPMSEDTTTNPLPPTPRRKDVVDETREGKEEDSRKQKRSSNREEREKQDEIIRTRLSRTRQVKQTRPTTSLDSAVVESKANDWAYNALLTPFSPKSVATDDEIRAEVSSVGMESETLRPVNYPNPYVRSSKPSKPSSKKHSRRDEDAAIVRTSSEPSSISDSTLSPPTAVVQEHQQQQQTIKKVKSADSGRRSHDVSQASGSTTSKKLWKGWRKAVGKVKAIVKDIDEQRIPPPLLHPPAAAHSGTTRQSKHPMAGVKQSQRKSKIPRS